MMNKWFSSISIVVMLMVVASSVIQFHHHDDEGNIIWGVTSLLCSSHDNDDACDHPHQESVEHSGHCCCGNHHQDHSCGTGDNCTAHLGDYQIAKQTSLSLNDYPTTLFVAIFHDSVELISISNFYCDLTYTNPNPHTHDGVINVASLRAPPMS